MPEMKVRLNQPARAFILVRDIPGNVTGLRSVGVLSTEASVEISDNPIRVPFDHANRTVIFFTIERGRVVTLWRELSPADKREIRGVFPHNPLLSE